MTMGRAAVIAEPASPAQIRASIDATARATVYRSLGAGYSRERAMREAASQLGGSMGRHVLNGGRETITRSIDGDDRCLGWARVTDAEPCPFCAMLASRGPVYKDQTVRFLAHDHCTCGAEPVYEGSKWPGRSQEFHDLWQGLKAQGHYGQDTWREFRKALTP